MAGGFLSERVCQRESVSARKCVAQEQESVSDTGARESLSARVCVSERVSGTGARWRAPASAAHTLSLSLRRIKVGGGSLSS